MVVPFRQLSGTSPNLTVVRSGVLTNALVAQQLFGIESVPGIVQAGRLTGYELNFDLSGNTFPKSGVFVVGTDVSLFRDSNSAQAFITRRLNDFRKALGKTASGLKLLSVQTFSVKVPSHALGLQYVASLGKQRLYGTTVDFAVGSLLGDAGLGRTDSQDVRETVTANARALAKRMSGVLSGRIKG